MKAEQRHSLVRAGAAEEIRAQARVAGLRDFQTPTLEAVERRRWQLWGLAAFFVVALAGGMALLSAESAAIQGFSELVPLWILRILFVGFAAVLGFYLFDKETRLAKLTRRLTDEKVLSAALSNRLKELSILSEVGKAINQVLILEDVLRTILRSALDLLEAHEGSVMLVEGHELVVAAAETQEGKSIQGLKVPLGKGIAGWVAENREPILISGRAPTEMFEDLQAHERPISSAISVPLVGRGELYGVLNVNDVAGERDFTEYDLRAVGLFAEHAAIAIRNSRIFEQERDTVRKLAELDRMKSEFMATITHELRTPLTSIIGCAKTVRQRGESMEEVQRNEFLEMIERQGERLLRMIEEMLSASKIESGGATLRREPVELVEVVGEVVTAHETAGAPNPLKVETPESVLAYGDRMAFEQIVNNLVENAIKYTEAPSAPVFIRLANEPGAATLKVADQGVGISEHVIPTVFDRFRQVDQSSTRRTPGVGLGLYIVKNLVDAMGGHISVESQAGKGSTFTVTFPKRKGDRGGPDSDS